MSITRAFSDKVVIEAMEQIMEICAAGMRVRSRENVRVRQPLSKLELVDPDGKYTWIAYAEDAQEIIKDEVNVKEIVIYYDGMKIVC